MSEVIFVTLDDPGLTVSNPGENDTAPINNPEICRVQQLIDCYVDIIKSIDRLDDELSLINIKRKQANLLRSHVMDILIKLESLGAKNV